MLIVGVEIEENDLVVSLLGGPNNVVGTLRFHQEDSIKLHDLRREAEALMDGNILVDLAFSLSKRWRLIGCNRAIVGGFEPTKLNISQTLPESKPKQSPKKIDKGGLGWPEAWRDE